MDFLKSSPILPTHLATISISSYLHSIFPVLLFVRPLLLLLTRDPVHKSLADALCLSLCLSSSGSRRFLFRGGDGSADGATRVFGSMMERKKRGKGMDCRISLSQICRSRCRTIRRQGDPREEETTRDYGDRGELAWTAPTRPGWRQRWGLSRIGGGGFGKSTAAAGLERARRRWVHLFRASIWRGEKKTAGGGTGFC
ncbi:unnamed protein product [Linum trigynum]|uniref:Uncharacterized protein n=1 Tax=Linum trigynum TaxID=586398 RepID=A0AAV2CP57_9ROSI